MEHAKYGETVVNPDNIVHDGMSLRDYFASRAPAPPEWWMSEDCENSPRVAAAIARWNYFYADAMLLERDGIVASKARVNCAAVADWPSNYVNAAGILASDKPAAVVQKLDAAMLRARMA